MHSWKASRGPECWWWRPPTLPYPLGPLSKGNFSSFLPAVLWRNKVTLEFIHLGSISALINEALALDICFPSRCMTFRFSAVYVMWETFSSGSYRWSVLISQVIKWRILVPLLSTFPFPSMTFVSRFYFGSVKAENIPTLHRASLCLAHDLVLMFGNQWVVPASSWWYK